MQFITPSACYPFSSTSGKHSKRKPGLKPVDESRAVRKRAEALRTLAPLEFDDLQSLAHQFLRPRPPPPIQSAAVEVLFFTSGVGMIVEEGLEQEIALQPMADLLSYLESFE